MGDKRTPLRGLLHYSPEKEWAKVVILNDMGMKLLISEIKADNNGYESKPLFMSPFLRALPNFYDEAVLCIFETFLLPETSNASRKLSIKKEGEMLIGKRSFARRIIIENDKKDYALALFLNSGTQVEQ